LRAVPTLLLLLIGLAALAPAAGAVTRHPSQFTGVPLVDGYILVPAPWDAAVQYRILEAVASIVSLYNVTHIAATYTTCTAPTLNGAPTLLYSATIIAWNNGTGTRLVFTTGPGPDGSSYVPITWPINVTRRNTSITLPGPDRPGLALARALGSLAESIANESLIEKLQKRYGPTGVPVVRLLPPEALPARDSLKLFAARAVNITFLESLSLLGAGASGVELRSPCSPPSGAPTVLVARNMLSSLLGGLSAILETMPSAGGQQITVVRIPLFNLTRLRSLLFQLFPSQEGNNTVVNPPVNVSIEEIRKAIANGTMEDALEALKQAKQLWEKGAISAEELKKLVELFKKRFGYDPLQQQQQENKEEKPKHQNTGPQTGPKPVQLISIDLDKLLQSIQSLQAANEQIAPGGGQAGLPQLRVGLPGIRETLQAFLALASLIAMGMAYSERATIILTLRALLCRPPRRLNRRGAVEWSYMAALRLLELRGLPKEPWETPREYLRRVGPLLGPLRRALEELTSAYEAAVYRMEEVPRGVALGACQRLARALRNPLVGLGQEPREAPA